MQRVLFNIWCYYACRITYLHIELHRVLTIQWLCVMGNGSHIEASTSPAVPTRPLNFITKYAVWKILIIISTASHSPDKKIEFKQLTKKIVVPILKIMTTFISSTWSISLSASAPVRRCYRCYVGEKKAVLKFYNEPSMCWSNESAGSNITQSSRLSDLEKFSKLLYSRDSCKKLELSLQSQE